MATQSHTILSYRAAIYGLRVDSRDVVADAASKGEPSPKEHIKERLGFSPDGGDAAALTFAFPVSARDEWMADADDWSWAQDDTGRSSVTGY